ncbi:MAG: hypothetical protein ACHQ17_05590 [Polyangia bacterium]
MTLSTLWPAGTFTSRSDEPPFAAGGGLAGFAAGAETVTDCGAALAAGFPAGAGGAGLAAGAGAGFFGGGGVAGWGGVFGLGGGNSVIDDEEGDDALGSSSSCARGVPKAVPTAARSASSMATRRFTA